MICCPKCGNKMNNVMHFEKNKSLHFNRCNNKKCNYETKKKKMNLSTYFK